MTDENKPLRVLVGDDQIGVRNSLQQKAFLRNYGGLASFDFSDKADDFIARAREGRYDALLIDLNWEDADAEREYKTGFRVLDAVKEYSPRRLLHTSEDQELRQKGFFHGATNCIEKYRARSYLEEALKGGAN